jgi:hypothetical protein
MIRILSKSTLKKETDTTMKEKMKLLTTKNDKNI